MWCVYDRNPMPENGPGPLVWAPQDGSWTRAEAEAVANELHDEDGDGGAQVVELKLL